MGYKISEIKLAKQVVHTAYGMSFAKAYAICRDAGLSKAEAEGALEDLAMTIHHGAPEPSAAALLAHELLEKFQKPASKPV